VTQRKNILWHELHEDDEIDRIMRERSSVDVSDPNPTAGAHMRVAHSAPAEGDVSDHYRISSPNRIRVSGDNGKMRHHRSR
jgi:hypothetical protein